MVSLGGPWEIGGAVWGAGPGPVLTMPGRSAYLGSAMAAARRGWGTEASVEPGPVTGWGRGWVRVPGSGDGKGSGRGAGSLATGVAWQQGTAKVARTARYHTPGEAGIGESDRE